MVPRLTYNTLRYATMNRRVTRHRNEHHDRSKSESPYGIFHSIPISRTCLHRTVPCPRGSADQKRLTIPIPTHTARKKISYSTYSHSIPTCQPPQLQYNTAPDRDHTLSHDDGATQHPTSKPPRRRRRQNTNMMSGLRRWRGKRRNQQADVKEANTRARTAGVHRHGSRWTAARSVCFRRAFLVC